MSDFKTRFVLNCELEYPRLNQYFWFNSATRKSEPCDKTRPGAEKSVGFKLPKDEAAKLWNDAKAHFNDVKSRKPDMGDFQTIHSYRENDDGTISFKAKRKGMTARGTPGADVAVVDGNNDLVEDLAFWGGSIGGVKFSMLPTFNQSKGEWGITFMLDKVQVTEPKYGSDGGEDFPIQNPVKPAPKENSAAKHASDDLYDDAIPF